MFVERSQFSPEEGTDPAGPAGGPLPGRALQGSQAGPDPQLPAGLQTVALPSGPPRGLEEEMRATWLLPGAAGRQPSGLEGLLLQLERQESPEERLRKRFFVKKAQRVTLKDRGIPNWVMDEMKPQIRVKDWYFNVDNSHYQLTVKLLSADCQVLQDYCKMFEVRERVPTVEEWREVSYTFENYPSGVRYVDFEHRVGWRSAVKVTNSSIAVDLV
ncbi:F-box only protein 44, partial [Ophiophagus hannah]